MDLEERGSGKEAWGMGEGDTEVGIYCMREDSIFNFFKKRKNRISLKIKIKAYRGAKT